MERITIMVHISFLVLTLMVRKTIMIHLSLLVLISFIGYLCGNKNYYSRSMIIMVYLSLKLYRLNISNMVS